MGRKCIQLGGGCGVIHRSYATCPWKERARTHPDGVQRQLQSRCRTPLTHIPTRTGGVVESLVTCLHCATTVPCSFLHLLITVLDHEVLFINNDPSAVVLVVVVGDNKLFCCLLVFSCSELDTKSFNGFAWRFLLRIQLFSVYL